MSETLRLVREDDGAVVAEELVLGDSFLARLLGLMGRRALRAGEALYLEPCASIHMLFMRFRIDVLFVGPRERVAAGPAQPLFRTEVLKVCPDVLPWLGIAGCLGASAAIELEAGRAAAAGLRAGDRLAVREAA